MKMKIEVLLIVFLAVVLLPSTLLISATTSTAVYNPWYDLDGDGKITIYDVVKVTGIYGSSGEPFTALAALQYDSGWIDITDKAGEYFNITHNMNRTDIIVDIQGKTTTDSGPHQKHLGLTGYTPGWSRAYGGTAEDCARCVVQTSDGGYAIVGNTQSFGAGKDDFWLVKIDSSGNMQWNRTYGGTNYDIANSVVQSSDGGYAIAGKTKSSGAGDWDMWLVKADSSGNHEWNKTYGGTEEEWAGSLVQTSDGGYALAGCTWSFAAEDMDFWLVKTYANGTKQWDKAYGAGDWEYAFSVVQTSDGGYALAGAQWDTSAYCYFWLVKTYANGTKQWDKAYEAAGYTHQCVFCVIQTCDGGYALAGETYTGSAESSDSWLVKTDSSGTKQWDKTYGGAEQDYADSVVETCDGGYAIACNTYSFGAGSQFWLVKTDAGGNVEWNRTYGGTNYDVATSLAQTSDGGYALAGGTWSFGVGNLDFWLVKTEVESGLAWTDSTADTITLYRGATDAYWNYVRVRIWKIKDNP